ncbi:MAG: LamG domain-containing protein [bacterium]
MLDGYGLSLDSIMSDRQKNGDLDSCIVIRAEKKRFEVEKTVPSLSEVDVAFRVAAGNYYKARAGILKQYISSLDDLVKAEVQADRIESAQAVKVEKEKTEFILADMQTKLPSTYKVTSTRLTEAQRAALFKGCILYYSFDMDEGNKVTDKSGKGNDGRVLGAKWTKNGRSGGAYEFKRKDNQLVSLKKLGISGAAPRTVAMWVNLVVPSSQGSYTSVLGWGGGGSPLDNTFFCLGTLGREWLLWACGGGCDWNIGKTIAGNEWVHIVVTYDGEVARAFGNGELVGTGDRHAYNTFDSPLRIGESDHQVICDGVMIWDRALSEQEVKQLCVLQGGEPK